jgi:hypothetical protein
MATKTEVEVAITPKAIASAKQYLAQPQVMKRLVELVGGFIVGQEINGTPLAHFLRGRPVESSEVSQRALTDDDFLQVIAPDWLKICHWAAWDQALREMDVQQFPSDEILKTVRPLALTIANDPQHKAACLENLATLAARAEPRLDIEPYGIPQAFLNAFQEKENQGS